MRKITVLCAVYTILAGGLLMSATSALAQSFDVKTTTLKNGMKVLVQEDHSVPSVAFYIFYRIGSRNERPGTTGISQKNTAPVRSTKLWKPPADRITHTLLTT
jgi:hypothetical protein